MAFQRVTIKDLAQELGFSTSTVSRALRGHKDISPETINIVKKLAVEREYEPDVFALMLKQQASKTIGVVVPNISHHFFASFVSKLQECANYNGYRTIICQSADAYDREVSLLRSVFATRIDGLAIAISKETNEMEHIQRLQKRKLPMVFFDRASNVVRGNTVITDDYLGARAAVEHLWAQGYSKIAYVGADDPLLLINEVREDGYKEALEDLGAPIKEEWLVKMPSASMVHGLEAGLKLLSLKGKNRPDAIFAADDHLAVGVLQAAKLKELHVPQDLGIVGYGNAPFTAWMNPTLSTVKQNSDASGKLTFELLLQEINSNAAQGKVITSKDPECHILPTELIARGSSQPNAS